MANVGMFEVGKIYKLKSKIKPTDLYPQYIVINKIDYIRRLMNTVWYEGLDWPEGTQKGEDPHYLRVIYRTVD